MPRIPAKITPVILKGNANAVYSPACILEGLRLMRMGADDVSASEIDELIGVEKLEGNWLGLDRADGWAYEDYKAHLVGGVWLDKSADPSPAFVESCRAGEVPVAKIDFAAPGSGEQVTQWTSSKTEGLLAPAVDLDADALACVASALYFKDAWKNGFDKRETERGPFHAEGGKVDADFMTAEASMPVVDAGFGEIVGFPLSNGASMVFVLPNEDTTLADLIADGALLEAVRDLDASVIDVELHVPKFSCETTVEDMDAALARAGFSSVKMPDLSPMVGRDAVPASCVHGAKIAIDEDGIEAGAYFAVVAAGALPDEWEPPKPRVIVLDRPFAYVVVSRTGQPLFMGTVCSPEADPYAWLPCEPEREMGGGGGWIVEDEETPGLCRITLEEDGCAPYVIACDVYGLMAHEVSVGDYDDAMSEYEEMKQELGEYARLLDGEEFDAGAWYEKFIEKRRQ